MTHYISPVAARQVAASLGLHITTPAELEALVRLANAAAQVRLQADTGVLFEGYDGAEPQRSLAAAALDELEDATDAAIAALQAIAVRSRARQVHHL
jgi:hypothetical protein